jgi:hypothetical protein
VRICDDRTIVGDQGFDDMRLAELAVTGDHRVGAGQLQGRHVGGIAEASAGKIRFIAGIAGDSRALATELDSGFFAESEVAQVLIETL